MNDNEHATFQILQGINANFEPVFEPAPELRGLFELYFSSRTRCTCLRTHIMVIGTRGRYAGSRRRSDGGELLISYSLYLSPNTHNGGRDQGTVRWK